MKTLTRLTLVALALVLAWYIAADRMTPLTKNARVKAVVTPIVPQVSGPVTEIAVSNAQLVEAGTVLARIDPRPFELAAGRAHAEIDAAAQTVGVNAADVARAQAQLTQARATLETQRLQTGRVFELETKGLVPVAQADAARNVLAEAETAVTLAEAELERARQALGSDGAENPRIRSALADLSDAELDLEYATLRAPAEGAVVDLHIAEGAQARTGQPLMTFVDSRDVWIEAYLTENNISRLEVGQRAEVALDIHPGRVFEGVVQSITGAASVRGAGSDGLPSPPELSGWLRAPQRFPVRIVLPDHTTGDIEDDVRFILNGQADVIVYTGTSRLMNALGAAYIRVAAWLSYAY